MNKSKEITPLMAKKWELNTALLEFLPSLTLREIQTHTDNILKYIEKPEQIDDFIRQLALGTNNFLTDLNLKEYNKQLHKQGYTIQQMILLANSPEIAPDMSRPREELLLA